MKKVEYVGKSLLIDKGVLVLSDLHLGYGGALEESGVMVPVDVYQEIFEELEEIFVCVGKVEKVVLLGDIKHEMGRISQKEWKEVANLLEYLRDKCEEIIVIRGNHDNIIGPLIKSKNILAREVFIWKDCAFFHGNKDFEEIHDKKIKFWVLGHLHPAVTLISGAKSEKYKCFLEGEYKRKKVIVMPSFFPFNEGTDPRDGKEGVWGFNFGKFAVKVIGNNLEVLDFGKLKNVA